MMKKRLLCALLLLALALSLLPTVALADDAYTAGTAEELQSLLGQRKTPIKLTDNINRVSRENLTGIQVVHAYNAEAYQAEKFEGPSPPASESA